jgi:hypothetical protein
VTITLRNFPPMEGDTMYQGIRPYVTTGVALVGASVIAVAPVTVPAPELRAAQVAAAAERTVTMAEVQLSSVAEDLSRLVGSVVEAPGEAVGNVVDTIALARAQLELATSPQDVVAVLAIYLNQAYGSAISPFLDPLTVNVPGGSVFNPAEWPEWDFIDAVAATTSLVIEDALGLVTLPTSFVGLVAQGQSPLDAVRSIAANLLLDPALWALPAVIALTNATGGVPNPGLPAEDQGPIFSAFLSALEDYNEFILTNIAPDMTFAAQEAGVMAAPADPWPPNAETVGETLETVGNYLAVLPGALVDLAVRDAETFVALVAQGRPVDAFRWVAASAIGLPVGLAELPAFVGATFLPPPIGGIPDPSAPPEDRGLITNGFLRTLDITQSIQDRIRPEPPEALVEQRQAFTQIEQAPNPPADVVDPTPPTDPGEDQKTVKVNGATDLSGGNLWVPGKNNNAATGGSNNRPLGAVSETVRNTVNGVRDAVKNTVKKVTGLGDKGADDSEQSGSSDPASPK